MIEKEIKILLNHNQYKKVLSTFDFKEEFIQTNYYYKSEGASTDITIRVREKENKTKLQIKIPKKKQKSLHIKEEYEEEIIGIPDIICKDKLITISGDYFFNDAVYIGKLSKKRRIYVYDDNTEIALDINEYLGKIDYELEIEFRNSYPAEIIEKFKLINISVDNSTEGKNIRFCKKLQEIGGES